MFIRKNKLMRLVSLAILLVLLSSCKKSNFKFSENKDKIEYVLSLSRMLENRAELIFIDKDGSIIEQAKYKGGSINSLNYFDNKIYMHSYRTNEHFIYDDKGFEKFSLESE